MQGLFHPVIWRELSRELRRQGLYEEWFLVAGAGNALGMASAITGDPHFHQIPFVAGIAFAAWKTLSLTMSAFAEERRNRTQEILFSCGFVELGSFLMKLIGGMARAATHLIGILPFPAFPFLAGELVAELFFSTIAALVLCVFFVFAAGAFSSTICREDEHALAVALLLIGTFPLVTACVRAFFSASSAFSASADWLWICPGYLVVLILGYQLQSFSAADVWDAGMATLGWEAALLLVAFRMIGGSGQDDQTVVERFRACAGTLVIEEVLRPAVVCGRNG